MRLYYSPTSPYSRKVRVALIEMGLAEQVEMIKADPFAPSEEFLATNPLSRVPALHTDDNGALLDSTLIIDYLQARHPGHLRALPEDDRRWPLLRQQYLAEGILDAAVATRLERRRPEGIIYLPFLDRQHEVILRSLSELEPVADTLSSDRLGALELTLACALDYLDFRLPYLHWDEKFPALKQWQARIAQRPSLQETQPPQG